MDVSLIDVRARGDAHVCIVRDGMPDEDPVFDERCDLLLNVHKRRSCPTTISSCGRQCHSDSPFLKSSSRTPETHVL